MVRHENKWDSNASRAPILQSSPTSFGNTTVFNPHGMHAMITADGYTASGSAIKHPTSLHSPNTASGKRHNRKAENTYAVRSVTSSFSEKPDSTTPVNSMLTGPTHAAEEFNTLVITEGIGIPVRPNTIPNKIAAVRGLHSFLSMFPFPVSIA